MQSALIVHSKHTKTYAEYLAQQYKNVSFLEIRQPPTEEVLKIDSHKDIVIGVGGGSVIDVAKIISGDKRCIAIPTTASGAALTPYATVWSEEKHSIRTKLPILKVELDVAKDLPHKVCQSTAADALSHAIESFWSKKATAESMEYAKKAIYLMNQYFKGERDINVLISAGNLAGQAIAIAETNVIHATSYSITIEYGVNHGTACGLLLPYFVEYMDWKRLPKLFKRTSTNEVVDLFKVWFDFPKIIDFRPYLIAEKTFQYEKIKEGPKSVSKQDLVCILSNLIGENYGYKDRK